MKTLKPQPFHQPKKVKLKDLKLATEELKTGQDYYVKDGINFWEFRVRQRLIEGTYMGTKIHREETQKQYKDYKRVLLKQVELNLIYIK